MEGAESAIASPKKTPKRQQGEGDEEEDVGAKHATKTAKMTPKKTMTPGTPR